VLLNYGSVQQLCIGHAHAVDPSGPAGQLSRFLSGAAGHCMRQCVVQPLLAVAAMDGLMDDGDRWVESYHTRERIQR
jgi:hypothetical protein